MNEKLYAELEKIQKKLEKIDDWTKKNRNCWIKNRDNVLKQQSISINKSCIMGNVYEYQIYLNGKKIDYFAYYKDALKYVKEYIKAH